MKVLLVSHGYPPDLEGGTEHSVRALAHGLLREGHQVVVLAGTDAWQEGFRTSRTVEFVPDPGAELVVWRIHRADLHYEHWQKASHPAVGQAYREILRRERPDVVHVHHWIRLTTDLVTRAAWEGVPAVVTLHDLSATCLLHHRLRPDTYRFCGEPLGPEACLDCAGKVHLATPWLAREEQAALVTGRRTRLRRELSRARSVFVLCDDQGEVIERQLALSELGVRVSSMPPGSDVAPHPAPELPPPAQLGAIRLGCWGSVYPVKGVDVVIEAMARVRTGELPIELHVAGHEPDPEYRNRLEELAGDLAVRFHGPYSEGRLHEHAVTAVHAFVSGTRARETWGVVLNEALALRLPMLLPRFGAYADRMEEGRGVLFYDSGDARSLAQVLSRVQRDPSLLDDLRAHLPRPADAIPSPQECAARLVPVYRDAVRSGAPVVDGDTEAADAEEIAWIEGWDARMGAGPAGSEAT